MVRLVFGLIALIFFSGCQNPADQNPVLGIVKNFSGNVFYHPADSVERLKLQSSDIEKRPLFPLDKIVVEENSFLHMYIYNHGDLFLEPNSTVLLQRPDPSMKFQVYSKIIHGTLDCFVEKRSENFGVQTPVAVAGVLGTSFQIQVGEDGTRITLLESKTGIEIQNLKQNLKSPVRLKTYQGENGQVYGQEIHFSSQSQTEATSEDSPAEASEKSYRINTKINPANYTYPFGAQSGRLLYRPVTEPPGTRVHSYER